MCRNHLLRVCKENFSGLRLLQRLFLSKSGIRYLEELCFTGLPELRVLALEGNKIRKLARQQFIGTPKLEELDLSNNGAMVLEEGCLTHANLLKLNLQQNPGLKLVSGSLSELPKLRTLYLGSCGIGQLEVTVLCLPQLRFIDLSGNHLTKLTKGMFDSMPELIHLILQGNKIYDIQPQTFQKLSRLKKLDLSENSLTALKSIFAGVGNLAILNLAGNNIKEVEEDCLQRMPSLQLLDMSENTLSELPAGFLYGLRQLRTLLLSGNVLKTLGARPFLGSPGLSHLKLAGNSLVAIPDTAFADLELLEKIDLRHNKLVSLPASIVKLPKLKDLALEYAFNGQRLRGKNFKELAAKLIGVFKDPMTVMSAKMCLVSSLLALHLKCFTQLQTQLLHLLRKQRLELEQQAQFDSATFLKLIDFVKLKQHTPVGLAPLKTDRTVSARVIMTYFEQLFYGVDGREAYLARNSEGVVPGEPSGLLEIYKQKHSCAFTGIETFTYSNVCSVLYKLGLILQFEDSSLNVTDLTMPGGVSNPRLVWAFACDTPTHKRVIRSLKTVNSFIAIKLYRLLIWQLS